VTADATCGTATAFITDGNGLELRCSGWYMEVDRYDVDDLFEVFRLLAAGGLAENQSARLERTTTGGLTMYRRSRGVWQATKFDLDREHADDLCTVIAEIMT